MSAKSAAMWREKFAAVVEREQAACAIERCVVADGGEHVEDFAVFFVA
jgi:hypothetical protein